MASNSIIALNVGGQIFQTSVNTLTKYPDSMLCAMFSYTKNGMSPMPKTAEGQYFLDVDPEYFRIVLNWLRMGEVIAEESSVLKGVLALANYFGLEDLMEELKSIKQKDPASKKCVKKQNIPEMVYLHLGKIKHRSHNEKPFEIRKSHLTRVPDSMIAKYFCGNFKSQEYYLPIADTDHFVLDRRRNGRDHFLQQCLCEFFECESSTSVLLFPDRIDGSDQSSDLDCSRIDDPYFFESLTQFKKELELFGILENRHYDVEHIDYGNESVDSEVENTFNYRHEYCFKWKEEFILKYTNPD